MKWTNKGHQFDGIGDRFKNAKHVAIYGCGANAKYYLNLMSILGNFIDRVDFFIDYSQALRKRGFMGKPVISLTQFQHDYQPEDTLVLVSPSEPVPYQNMVSLYGGYPKTTSANAYSGGEYSKSKTSTNFIFRFLCYTDLIN